MVPLLREPVHEHTCRSMPLTPSVELPMMCAGGGTSASPTLRLDWSADGASTADGGCAAGAAQVPRGGGHPRTGGGPAGVAAGGLSGRHHRRRCEGADSLLSRFRLSVVLNWSSSLAPRRHPLFHALRLLVFRVAASSHAHARRWTAQCWERRLKLPMASSTRWTRCWCRRSSCPPRYSR